MPNHITNILDVTGSVNKLEEFRNKVFRANDTKENEFDSDWIFDFNGTVPMPESMHITCPAHTEKEKAIYKANKEKYGFGDWYEWAHGRWSTKWGGYDAQPVEEIPDGLRFRFNTAWSPPAQWVLATAQQFPELQFKDSWTDEGGGSGIYSVGISKGEPIVNDAKISDHEWRMEFNDNYRDEYEFITQGEYKDLIQNYVVEKQEISSSELQLAFIARVKNEDLPKLKKLELWDEAKEQVEVRLEALKDIKVAPRHRKIIMN